MRHFSALVLLFVSASFLSAATIPDCVEGTAQQWINYGAAGCKVGIFTIKNVAWNTFTGTEEGVDYLNINPQDVTLTAVTDGGQIGLGFFSSRFNVTGNQGILAFLDYLIDPPPPIFDDFQLEMVANSPQGAGTARINALVCAGDTLNPECNGEVKRTSVFYFGNGNKDLVNRVEFSNPVNMIDVRLTIELLANGDSSQIDGGRQVTAVVPEPAAFLLFGSGALLLAGLRRFRNS